MTVANKKPVILNLSKDQFSQNPVNLVEPVQTSPQLFEDIEDILCLRARGGAQIAPDDAPVFDEERLAIGHAERERHTERLRHRAFRIGEQDERQTVLLLEAELRPGIVRADADHAYTTCLPLREVVAETARLRGAAGRVGFGIKVDQGEAVAVKAGQTHFVAPLVAR